MSFKIRSTRKNNDGNYLHVNTVKLKSKKRKAEFAGDLQEPIVTMTIDENGKNIVRIKNAYDLNIVTYKGDKEKLCEKVNKETGETIEVVKHIKMYDTQKVCYIQGTDGQLYLVVGEGTKVKGTMTEGWGNLSAYVRNLVQPARIIDNVEGGEYIFNVNPELISFTPVQVTASGVVETSPDTWEGYLLSLKESKVSENTEDNDYYDEDDDYYDEDEYDEDEYEDEDENEEDEW